MKCSKCGEENPEQVEFCTECGTRLPEAQSGNGIDRSRRGVNRLTGMAIIAIIAIIAGPLLVYVYFNPDYSWSGSVRDSDGDGFADTSDVFPDNPAEWTDNDSDGVGDNADLFDYGNAVVWISVDLYLGDGTADLGEGQDGTAGDPYFMIQVSLSESLVIVWEEPVSSDVLTDTEKIIDPFSVRIDVPENQGHFSFRVYVYDDDGASSEVIVLGTLNQFVEHHFGQPFSKSFIRDSTNASSVEPGCLLVYSIALGSEEYGEP